MLGRVTYDLENVYFNGGRIIGIDSFDSEVSVNSEQISIMGKGFVDSLPNAGLDRSVNFSMYTCAEERSILLKSLGINLSPSITYAYRTSTDEEVSKKWSSLACKLTSYELSCAVGELAKSSFSFDSIGEISTAGTMANSSEAGTIIVAKPGDVTISGGDIFEENALQSFSYKFEIPLSKRDRIGGSFVPTVELNEPIKITVDFEFILNDASSLDIEDIESIFCETGFAATFGLYNCGTPVRKLSISNARLTSCSINGSVGDSATLSVSYEAHVRTYSELISMAAIYLGDFQYVVVDDKAKITGYAGSEAELVIPSLLGNYPVYAIGDSAFANKDFITSLVIPDSVDSILDGAFSGCSSLTGISIGGPLETAGEGIFYDCSLLSTATVESGALVLGEKMFYNCDSLTGIEVPSTVTGIGDLAFASCEDFSGIRFHGDSPALGEEVFNGIHASAIGYYFCENTGFTTGIGGLEMEPICDYGYEINGRAALITGYYGDDTDLYVPETLEGFYVTGIGDNVFRYKSGISRLTLPDSVLTIGANTFEGCLMGTMDLPTGIYSIGSEAFYRCSGITEISIPGALSSIGYSAFRSCTGISDIEFGGGISSIGDFSFFGIMGIESIELPHSVVSIGSLSFASCGNLKTAYLGTGLASINTYAFSNCTGLTGIFFSGNAPSVAATSFNNIGAAAVGYYYCEKTGFGSAIGGIDTESICDFEYSIEDNKATILGYNGTNEDILIPETLEGYIVAHIGTGAFYQKAFATGISMPTGVESFASGAFYGCSGISEMEIPTGTTVIQENLFRECAELERVEVPIGTTGINSGAFADCIKLAEIYFPTGLTAIAENAFSGCLKLETIFFSGHAPEMGEGAFDGISEDAVVYYYCENTGFYDGLFGSTPIESVCDFEYAIADEEVTITRYVGTGTSVSIPLLIEGYPVVGLADETFMGNTGIEQVSLRTGTTGDWTNLFYKCSNLSGVTLPENATQIGERMFYECYSLEEISLPSGITGIWGYSFYSCGLTGMDFPSGLEEIADGAFRGCTGLSGITFNGDAPTIGKNIFGEIASGARVYYYCGAAGFEEENFGGIPVETLCDYEFDSSEECGMVSINLYQGERAYIEIPYSISRHPVFYIGSGSFSGNLQLTGVSIPEKTTGIGDFAFSGCINLTGIIFNGDAPSVSESAFLNINAAAKAYYCLGSEGYSGTIGGIQTVQLECS